MALELVIFDCDGVLVDSEPLSNQLFVEALAGLDLHITLEECVNVFVGRPPETNVATIEKMLGRPVPENFMGDLLAKTNVHFSKHLEAIPGIETALSKIDLPVCVASSSTPDMIRRNLALTGLLDRFGENIFSSTQVKNGKPAPDIFLFAARNMDVKPESCVVVEDSVAGVKAGRAAGMNVLAYTGTFPKEALKEAGAHTLFDDMALLPQLIGAVLPPVAESIDSTLSARLER
jgi:HAD superfamily hydrolase (TIGR01509 family)